MGKQKRVTVKVAGVALAGAALVLSGQGIRDLIVVDSDEMRQRIYTQLEKVGWKGEQPKIYQNANDGQYPYVTDNLPVVGGCSVRLAFMENGRTYRVRSWYNRNPDEEILRVRGSDYLDYPAAIIAIGNPRRQDLDKQLIAAGLDGCTPLSK